MPWDQPSRFAQGYAGLRTDSLAAHESPQSWQTKRVTLQAELQGGIPDRGGGPRPQSPGKSNCWWPSSSVGPEMGKRPAKEDHDGKRPEMRLGDSTSTAPERFWRVSGRGATKLKNPKYFKMITLDPTGRNERIWKMDIWWTVGEFEGSFNLFEGGAFVLHLVRAEHLGSVIQNVATAPAASAGNWLETQLWTPAQAHWIRTSGPAAACNLTSARGDCDTLLESQNHCLKKKIT